ncbi:MAG: Holliday junction branch migration protein RuvA [Chloroflexota bacterium]
MIAAIEGTLQQYDSGSVVIKAGPLSLRVHVPDSTLGQMGTVGDRVCLYTHLRVREDNLSLFGFATPKELSLFETFLTVSGIGPRLALGLLSSLNTEQLVQAIISEDNNLLSQAPGVGKKMASRLILELKGKLEKEWEAMPAAQVDGDLTGALTALGYSLREAIQAASRLGVHPKASLEEKIRLALQDLSHR